MPGRTGGVPASHYALVGPLWVQIEQALDEAGARGAGARWQMHSLRHRLSREQVARLHYIRLQRNRLMHFPPRALDDPSRWERSCREAINDLRRGTHLARPASGTRPPGPGAIRRAPGGHAHALIHPSPRRPAGHPRPSDRDHWPTWAKGVAWGLGAWVVLTHEALLSLAMLAFLGWLGWTIFGRR
jgi:hypothetical protein